MDCYSSSVSSPVEVSERQSDYSVADRLLAIECALSNCLNDLKFTSPVSYVYNPLDYAFHLHSMFVKKYCDSTKRLLFLGMNPGPWGMAQTGIPFGEVSMVRDWFELNAVVGRPLREHPQRLVRGLSCHRSETSGRRFWGLLRRICSTPECALANAVVYNHCPLLLLSESGRNITPAELKKEQLDLIRKPCDAALVNVLRLLHVGVIVAIGKYAETRAKFVLRENPDLKEHIMIFYLPHPSPRNFGIKDWEGSSIELFQNLGITSLLKSVE
ncbi:single-strand selective monofunctional uracil DNA glycosylase-like isoform X1 [Hetaerina americana]|uniref:single-strand selective monofunctional uracil DNA glycosylase-like isoform X1 n=1 Tax=Hetaerina americana TaxID=62018 RepID=UPI003A7F4C1F